MQVMSTEGMQSLSRVQPARHRLGLHHLLQKCVSGLLCPSGISFPGNDRPMNGWAIEGRSILDLMGKESRLNHRLHYTWYEDRPRGILSERWKIPQEDTNIFGVISKSFAPWSICRWSMWVSGWIHIHTQFFWAICLAAEKNIQFFLCTIQPSSCSSAKNGSNKNST